jgi:Ca-activated chloride channel family protein
MQLRHLLLGLVVPLVACTQPSGGETLDYGGGDVGAGPEWGGGGVDTGGAQDISAAREVIMNGGVPQPDLITVEGLLSEHDVATSGAPCNSPICVRPATGIAPSLETGKLERWVHIGMTTGIDLTTWQRPPIDLVIAIDKSSSMGGDLAETTEAAARLIGKLTANDNVEVFAFDTSIHMVHALGPVGDVAALQTAVRGIHADGGWDINLALMTAYGDLATPTSGHVRRVVVESCSYPGISADHSDWASHVISENGANGIGMTFVGILLGYSSELAKLLGETNGGNYYYTSSLEGVQSFFDVDSDYLLTPVAYDLQLALNLSMNWSLERMYGIPGNADGSPASGYTVATAFFSKRRGSIVARLAYTGDGEPPPAAASVALSYRPEPALGWTTAENQTLDAMTGTPEPDGTYYGTAGVRKAVMLVNMAVRMIDACGKWQSGDHDAARTGITELGQYLASEQAQLMDPDMDQELALVQKLLANMGN